MLRVALASLGSVQFLHHRAQLPELVLEGLHGVEQVLEIGLAARRRGRYVPVEVCLAVDSMHGIKRAQAHDVRALAFPGVELDHMGVFPAVAPTHDPDVLMAGMDALDDSVSMLVKTIEVLDNDRSAVPMLVTLAFAFGVASASANSDHVLLSSGRGDDDAVVLILVSTVDPGMQPNVVTGTLHGNFAGDPGRDNLDPGAVLVMNVHDLGTARADPVMLMDTRLVRGRAAGEQRGDSGRRGKCKDVLEHRVSLLSGMCWSVGSDGGRGGGHRSRALARGCLHVLGTKTLHSRFQPLQVCGD